MVTSVPYQFFKISVTLLPEFTWDPGNLNKSVFRIKCYQNNFFFSGFFYVMYVRVRELS